MPRRWGEVGIPKHLGIQMGVNIDEAGSQHQTTQIDVGGIAVGQVADGPDPAVEHLDVESTTNALRRIRCMQATFGTRT